MAAIAETPVLTNADIKQINIRKAVKKEKYIGSVRFFKHLILTVLLILLTVPWVFVAFLAVKNSKAEKTIAYTEQMLEAKLMTVSNEDLAQRVSFIQDDIQAEVPYYQELYPDFYAPQMLDLSDYSEKTIYLTFDDGPSPRTPEVLAVLAEKDVKATFFVVGQNDEQSYQWMRDIVAQGHTLGMHTYTHQYNVISSHLQRRSCQPVRTFCFLHPS